MIRFPCAGCGRDIETEDCEAGRMTACAYCGHSNGKMTRYPLTLRFIS